ncbi:MAG: hypothetical protein ACM3NW_12945 [Syntrophomonadaceae bacterium]
MNPKTLRGLIAACALTFAVCFPLSGQEAGPGGGPRYDPKTEVTLKGTVEGVKETPSPQGGHAGMHVLLRTEGGTIEVGLGPAEYWKQHGFELVKADSIEVTGSKIKVGGGEILIAREVKKGDKTVTLRDASGVPAWSRGRRSP